MLHPLSSIDITKYFNDEPRFNGVFLRNNLPRMKDTAYVINLDDKKSKGFHWISLFIGRYKTGYLESFWIEYIPW